LPFDPVADFAGVALVGEAPAIVVVPPSLGVSSSLREREQVRRRGFHYTFIFLAVFKSVVN
jgi:hypothetical protein